MTQSSTDIENSACNLVSVRAALLTSFTPGAIAVIQLTGEEVALEKSLFDMTDKTDWPIHSMRLVTFTDHDGEIDTGLVARIAPEIAHLMPHGGPRVVQRIMARCANFGAEIIRADALPRRTLFPEANDDVEAIMLDTLSRAQSPLAIDLLLDQPRRWRKHTIPPPSEGGAGEGGNLDVHNCSSNQELSGQDLARYARLNRLIAPPLVVLAGPANVGKSTLSNKLLGRSMSIAVDQPGTTRDYITGHVELAGLVVLWHDTPGLRETDDPIELEAIGLASQLISRADYLIAMTDHEHDWPTLPREANLRVANKCDVSIRSDAQINISASTSEGVAELVRAVRDALIPPEDINHSGVWVFDERLLNVRAQRGVERRR